MIGQRLGQYEIIGELGEGGMATVYRARQVSINREVALKVIHPDLTREPGFKTRFEREARLIASLSHPHILKLFDYGQEDGKLYLVTELLSGGALSDIIERGPLPLEQIDRLLTQIASALDYAHQQGIIHRDLKPRNVLMDNNGNAILTDFGLAKLAIEDTRLTATGAAMGTPSYMSPEQWKGESIDARADIYSLGVMLYEMLVGKLPFKADSAFSLMFAHVNETPPLIDTLPGKLSPDMNRIIQRVLAKDRNDRFESAAALAESFHQVATGGRYVTPARSPLNYKQFTPVKNLMQPAARKGFWMPMAAAVASLAITLAIIAALVNGSRNTPGNTDPTSAPDVANVKVEPVAPDEFMVLVAQPEQLGKQRDVTRFIVADLIQNLDKSIPFSKLRVREFPQVITSALDAQAVAKTNNATVVVWGSAGDSSIDLQLQTGITSAFKYIKIPEDVVRRTGDVRIRLTDPRTQSIAPQVLTVLITLQGADGNAYEIMRSLALLDRLTAQGVEIQGNSTAAQVSRAMLIYLSDTPGFIQQITKVIDADPSNPLLYAFRGLAYQRLGMYDEGARDYATAGRLGPEAWTAPMYGLSIDAFFSRKDFNEGIARYSEIIKDRPGDWFPVTMRGSLYFFVGQRDLSKADLDKAMTMNPDANLPYTLSALLALHDGRIKDARKLFDLVLSRFPDPHLFERVFRAAFGDPNNHKVAYGSIISASNNLLIGQYDSAVTDIQTAIEVFPNFAELYMLEGFAQCSLGRYADAEKSLSQGIAIDPKFALLYALRAEVRRKQNNAPGALIDFSTLANLETGKELTALIQEGAKNGSQASCQSFFSYKSSTGK